jgi:hypothetical protein
MQNERRWYAEWRVWVCLVLFALCGIVQWFVGLPFRVLDAVWSVLF